MTRPHRFKRSFRAGASFFVAGAVTFSGVSCSASSNSTGSATTSGPNILQDLTKQPWVLDRATSSPPIAGATVITLTFKSDHTLFGAGPCNQYSGAFTLHGTTIKIGPLRQTLIACESPDNTAEHTYTNSLEAVHTVASTGQDHLKLKGDNGIALSYQAK